LIADSLSLRASEGLAASPEGIVPDWSAWAEADGESLAGCWLGHASVLLRVGGLTVLTDPHFGERSGPPVGAKRIGRERTAASVSAIDELPDVDVLLLSHAHFDHWDKATLARLAGRYGTRSTVVIPARTRRLLPRAFENVVELGWGGRAGAHGAHVSAIRPKHWGARWLWDVHRGYNSYLIEAQGRRVLFGGDTAHTDAFDGLAHDGGVDLAVLGIGSFEHWENAHATPEQAADMARRMGARLLLPIHHSTFKYESEMNGEPLARVCAAWGEDRVVCTRIGEAWAESGAQGSGCGVRCGE
jgi:L-ascorbate metabolism protein UlaG (beta-lactamase superfamily)